MFKTLFPSWYKKSVLPSKDIPTNFVANDNNKVVKYTMDEMDTFVDINYKKLSYAEVASLSKNRTRTAISHKSLKPAKNTPKPYNVFSDLDHDNLDDSLNESVVVPEKFKSDFYSRKHRLPKNGEKRKLKLPAT